ETTIAIWRDFVDQAHGNFRFDEQQSPQARTILTESEKYLERWLAANQQDILVWIGQADRLNGFSRDGERRGETFREVAGLNDHINSIARDRDNSAAAWLTEIETIWTELESRINNLHQPELPADERLPLARPWRSRPAPFGGSLRWSPQQLIDIILPWFDAAIGLLLVAGLFTRVAAIAGITLLLGVVATQPFWVMGSENTWYQWVEIAGLFVLFATAAGRFGGLDYFLWRPKVATPATGD
ncbi:MAG: DoxX family protein, partial [Pirellulaceae bacterium]